MRLTCLLLLRNRLLLVSFPCAQAADMTEFLSSDALHLLGLFFHKEEKNTLCSCFKYNKNKILGMSGISSIGILVTNDTVQEWTTFVLIWRDLRSLLSSMNLCYRDECQKSLANKSFNLKGNVREDFLIEILGN